MKNKKITNQESVEMEDIESKEPVKSKTAKQKEVLIAYKKEIMEAIITYLDTKPHREVRALIDEIQKGQRVEI